MIPDVMGLVVGFGDKRPCYVLSKGPSILVYFDKLKLNLKSHELWKLVPCVIFSHILVI